MNKSLVMSLHLLTKLHGRLERVFLKQKVVFLHIPKCGGTSISTAISQALGADCTGYIDPIQTRELAQYMTDNNQLVEGGAILSNIRRSIFFDYFKSGKPCIYGHFPVVKQCLLQPEDYTFVTILREPVERFISQYRYYIATRILKDNMPITIEKLDSIWFDYFSSDLAKYHANTLTAYLDDKSPMDLGNQDSLERAMNNLSFFKVVGFLDNLDAFLNSFNFATGYQIQIKSVKNKTDDKMSPEQIKMINQFFSMDKIDQITEACQQDTVLYNFAKKCTIANA